MGNAAGKVYNDTNKTTTIYVFNYADGLRTTPAQTHEIYPGHTQDVEASPHTAGLIVATGTTNQGRHYALCNGDTVNVSTILSHGDSNPAFVASSVFLAAGVAAAIAATGGAATAALAPATAAGMSAGMAGGIAGVSTFAATAAGKGIADGLSHAEVVAKLQSMQFFIVNTHSNKALDVKHSGTGNGTNVHIWEFNGSDAQKWKLMEGGAIVNPRSGKSLDVYHSGNSNGTNIHIWDRNGTGAQQWSVSSDGSIINVPTGMALDVTESGTANGTNVQLWDRNGTGAQKWVLWPVE